MSKPSDALDALTTTFSADKMFFDRLAVHSSNDDFLAMCVWYLWLKEYWLDFQQSLQTKNKDHGSEFCAWIASMMAGIMHSIGMIMYLTSRGATHEAAAAVRRSLEFLGIVSHLLRDPLKAKYLKENDQSADFNNAFVHAPNKEEKAASNKRGIGFRFAGMNQHTGQLATHLYKIFSQFGVHGGKMSSLIGVPFTPSDLSCMFRNRSLDETITNLPLFASAIEIVAMEIIELVGTYGARSTRINQAGACVIVWMDKSDIRWRSRIDDVRKLLSCEMSSHHPTQPIQ